MYVSPLDLQCRTTEICSKATKYSVGTVISEKIQCRNIIGSLSITRIEILEYSLFLDGWTLLVSGQERQFGQVC